jgi:hypothetical protein
MTLRHLIVATAALAALSVAACKKPEAKTDQPASAAVATPDATKAADAAKTDAAAAGAATAAANTPMSGDKAATPASDAGKTDAKKK